MLNDLQRTLHDLREEKGKETVRIQALAGRLGEIRSRTKLIQQHSARLNEALIKVLSV